MKTLLQPKWLLAVNIIPAAVLFVICITQYQIIESLLPPQSKLLWLKFAIALSIITFAQLVYLIVCWVKKRNASVVYAVLTLLSNTVFLYSYILYNSEIVPSSIPGWMLTSDVIFYPGTFLMPTMIYALIILVLASIPQKKKINPWLNLLYSIVFPLIAYLFFQIVLPLWRMPDDGFGYHVIAVSLTAITIAFIFFICRAIIAFLKRYHRIKEYLILWYILIGFVLPTIGLSVNNGKADFIFGDFSHPYFYIITLLNSILLCLTLIKNENVRLARFIGLIVFFPYVVYFFFVFLPFLPLSLVAIIAFGIGFLMLSPLLLFTVQARELYKEYLHFQSKISSTKLIAITLSAFLVIPVLITASNLRDKHTLNSALSYVYDYDADKFNKVNITSLRKTIATINQHKRRTSLSGGNIPFLSSYFNWLVLENMILSEEKINTIERIFFGDAKKKLPETTISKPTAAIASTTVSSSFNTQLNLWESTIHFNIKNNDAATFGTYETTFKLPTGCWISDYYLYVGKQKEHGILAEKKTALWIFKQIQNQNRDPGILYYAGGSKVAFKVFPFNKSEVRKTGITFIHQGKKTIEIDGRQILLGDSAELQQETIRKVANAVYLPFSEKAKLPLVKRRPTYHFLIDFSKGNDKLFASYVQRVQRYIENCRIKPEDFQIHVTKRNDVKLVDVKDWKNNLKQHPFDGGFFLEGAIRKSLTEQYQQNKNRYPIFVAVTNKIDNAIFLKDLSDLQFTFPENSNFYEMAGDGKIWEHSLTNNPVKRMTEIIKIPTQFPVYSWPNAVHTKAYLRNDGAASIILTGEKNVEEQFKPKSFEAALSMQASWQLANASRSFDNKEHLKLIRQSMKYQMLSPVTAFIVVENEAQKKMLYYKQKQILNGNKNLDTDEDTRSMSEPNLWLVLSIIVSVITFKRFHTKKKVTSPKPI